MRTFLILLVLPILALEVNLMSLDQDESEKLTRRIQAHLTIKDVSAAVEEAEAALAIYPHSISLHESYVLALAKIGDEKRLLFAWERMVQQFPDQMKNRELLESMAWGILQKASYSSSIIMREMALLAAYFSQDVKGAAILLQGMRDSNYSVRAVAVKLASHFRDHCLLIQIQQMFKEEKIWTVRKEIIEAIGKMKIANLRKDLEFLIASDESLAQEKVLAITALLELLDSINRVEIEKLTSSPRAGLRQLSSQAIAYFQSHRDLDQLFLLVKDPHPEVRLAAIQALGRLRPHGQRDKIISLSRTCVDDANTQVALSGAWLLTLYEPEEGQRAFKQFFFHERRDVRALAAAALGATGRNGIGLSLDQFRQHPDSMVRLNLAIGLIGQRCATQEAAEYLKLKLISDKEKWETYEAGIFKAIVHQMGKKKGDASTVSDTEHQRLRLELFHLLAILKTSNIQGAVREYLSQRSWEISATAAVSLLTEGDDSAIEIVKNLLEDPQPRVSLLAALMLSLWSREERAIKVLEEGFVNGDWETKSRILEGIGRIGSTESIPFLINVLKEPSQTLRLIAAMAIIQCLNH